MKLKFHWAKLEFHALELSETLDLFSHSSRKASEGFMCDA